MKRALFSFMLLLPAFAAAKQDAPPNPAELLDRAEIRQNLGAQMPAELQFRDENGRPARLGDYFGSAPLVLIFAYYDCPMLCEQVTQGLVRSIRPLRLRLGEDFRALTVSFNPNDTPEKARAKKQSALKELGDIPGGERGWTFLTGPTASIEALTRAAGYNFAALPEENQFAHAGAIVVLTPDGRASRYFFGIDYAPKDLRFALMEASDKKIGNVADRMLMLCYEYDPVTGKYGFAILAALRAGGIVTLAALGLFIAGSLRRERRAAREARHVG